MSRPLSLAGPAVSGFGTCSIAASAGTGCAGDLTSKLDVLAAPDSCAAGRVPVAAFERAIATISASAARVSTVPVGATQTSEVRLPALLASIDLDGKVAPEPGGPGDEVLVEVAP